MTKKSSDLLYFINYSYGNGVGRCQIQRKNPIRCIADIKAIEKGIVKEGDRKEDIIVTHWQKFEK